MHRPPGGGHNPREALELEARFSTLSAEISASLDTILARLQSAPADEHAIAVARDLVAAQQAVMHQLLLLRQGKGSPALATARPQPRLQHHTAHRLPLAPESVASQVHQNWQPAHDAHVAASHFDLAPQEHPASTLGDLLRQHLAAPATQPIAYDPGPPAGQPQPRPYRAHALELAPMAMPAGDHVVWTEQQPLHPAYAPEVPAPAYGAMVAEAAQAPRPMLAPATLAEATGDAALPAWAQQAAHRPALRYGVWAGGALAAIVVGLGAVLHAGRPAEPIPIAPPSDETATAQAETAAPPVTEPAEPAGMDIVQSPPPEAETAPPPPQEPLPAASTAAEPPPPASPPMSAPEPIQGALLPSAQNWLDQNGEPAPGPPPAVAKAQPSEKPIETGATGAVDKPRAAAPPKPAAPAAAPAPAAKKPEVAPFKTAVVKAPQGPLFAPVLLELKNADSLMRVFQDLQSRHGALAGKRAELRPAAGPNNETWFALLAVPASPKAEAEAICRAMGAEGATLRCRVIKY